jgi:transcriptional regulator with XRE-family HTH domain
LPQAGRTFWCRDPGSGFAQDLREACAANLRRLRHAKGISQEDLSYEADINRSYLSKLEKGASYPGLEIIAKLATVLEVAPAELLRLSAGGRTLWAEGRQLRQGRNPPK